ncbi:hypothetical protein ACP4OV_000033 [Aristida adscensionis]
MASKLLPASAGFLAGAGAGACPAYPWSPQDGAGGGHKVFMQSDCAACHSMLPHAARLAAASPPAPAEIAVVNDDAHRPAAAAATALHGGACTPDLAAVTKMLQGLRHSELYSAQELNKRMPLPTPAWLQLLEPFVRAPQAA